MSKTHLKGNKIIQIVKRYTLETVSSKMIHCSSLAFLFLVDFFHFMKTQYRTEALQVGNTLTSP